MEKITPRVDIAFKKIFGVEENTDLLISLINSVVSKEDHITKATLLNPYNPKHFKDDKLSILDIKAEGESGKRFNIEIQVSDEADYDKRALYYWAKLYTEQLKATEDYSTLCKAIGIHILNFTSIPSVDKYHNVFHVREKESNLLYFTDLELHTIELKKFTGNTDQGLNDIVAKIKSSLDMWVAFLTRHDLLNKEQLPKILDKPVLKKALNVLEVMSFLPEEREAYESHLKWLRVEANTLKKYQAIGEARGKVQGKAEGKAEGKIEGKAEGKIEAKLEIAKAMLTKNMAVSLIAEVTGLTEAEIEVFRS
jgi:predicted transposase/invertase (TIGR01784 family)